jgi:coenzyme F420-reducing hydrogenase delta subunit
VRQFACSLCNPGKVKITRLNRLKHESKIRILPLQFGSRFETTTNIDGGEISKEKITNGFTVSVIAQS